MQLSTAVYRLRERYFSDFDVAGDANHTDKPDGKVSILDLQRVASGKRFNGGTYPPDEVDVAKSILGNLTQFEANLGNKDVFTKEDLQFDDSHYKNGNDPATGKLTNTYADTRRRLSLLLNVYDQVDNDHNNQIDYNDISKFLTPALKKNYKATYDSLKYIVDNKALPKNPASKGDLGDQIGKLTR